MNATITSIIASTMLLAACAEQSAMRLNANTVRVNVSTAPIYGALEPERRAMRVAAEETIRHGYDSFIILDGRSDYRRNVIGHIPASASGSYFGNAYGGQGHFSARGAQTIAMPRFETAVTIRMYRSGEPGSESATTARSVLKSAE